jgi:hypothetical protein
VERHNIDLYKWHFGKFVVRRVHDNEYGITRTECYIGKNPWDSSVNVSNTVAYFDDI